MITKFGYEETSQYFAFADIVGKAFRATIWAFDDGLPINQQGIAFDPSPEVKRLRRNIIFLLTSHHTSAASDTLLYINPHPITMLFRIIIEILFNLGENISISR